MLLKDLDLYSLTFLDFASRNVLIDHDLKRYSLLLIFCGNVHSFEVFAK